MNFFDMISAYVNMIWSSVSAIPLFNTGITFGQYFIGFIGLSVLSVVFVRFFGLFNGIGQNLTYSRCSRSKNENISDARRHDER